MLLNDISMERFKGLFRGGAILLVPYGTVEAHGTHLPLGTDTIIACKVAEAVASRVDALVVAPPLNYGVCTSTAQHQGTIGISPSTLRALTKDIVRSSHRHGVRQVVLLSGHGGGIHRASMREAAEELVRELRDIKIAALTIYDILPREEVGSIIETTDDSHAGELETSVMLYLAEHLVVGRAEQEYPSFPPHITVYNKQAFWAGAVWGNPQKASREKGKRVFELMVSAVEGFIEDFKGFDETAFRED